MGAAIPKAVGALLVTRMCRSCSTNLFPALAATVGKDPSRWLSSALALFGEVGHHEHVTFVMARVLAAAVLAVLVLVLADYRYGRVTGQVVSAARTRQDEVTLCCSPGSR